MQSRWVCLLLGCGLAAALAACEKAAAPAAAQAAASASQPPKVSPADRPISPTTAPEGEARSAVARTAPDCRATSSAGNVRFGSGEALERGDKLIGKGWLELGADARVVVKHTQSAREWVLQGPALAAFCQHGREEVILGSGKLQTEMGAGARPGSEVTVGTPFGTVSYGDARLKLHVSDQALALEAEAGDAWLTPAGSSVAQDVRVAGGARERRTRRLRASDGLALCADAAKRSEELTRALHTPGGSGLGQRAAEQMRARKQARRTCANAAAAVIVELRGQARDERLGELEGHEQAWQRVIPAGAGNSPRNF